jgi:uncharacterized protein YqgV (UPF0045/DUF77 family)
LWRRGCGKTELECIDGRTAGIAKPVVTGTLVRLSRLERRQRLHAPDSAEATWTAGAADTAKVAGTKETEEVATMPRTSVSLQILPVVEDRDRMFGVVDEVIQMIDESGVSYHVGPAETTMEGDLDELLDIVKRAHALCHDAGVASVVSIVKIVTAGKKDVVSIADKIEKYR